MSTTKAPGILTFRGSITRPLAWLSTLRSEGRPSPRKTRFWLLARLCQAGLDTRRVPTKGFRVRGSSSLPKLSWRKVIRHYRRDLRSLANDQEMRDLPRRGEVKGSFVNLAGIYAAWIMIGGWGVRSSGRNLVDSGNQPADAPPSARRRGRPGSQRLDSSPR